MTKKHLFLALAATLLAVFTSCKGEEELDPQNPQDPQGPQAPELVSITPDTGIAGLSATISGKHFSATKEENKVLFGEAEATVAAATDTTLVVLVPENEPGEVKVAVIVGELTSNTLKFIYEVPVVEAKVTAIEPTHASVGDKVPLKGEGFGDSKEGYVVLFDETEAVIESVSDTEIVVVVPDTEDSEANVILQKADHTYIDGTVTDTTGRFVISAHQEAAMIQISFIGYETAYRQLDEVSKIKLNPDTEVLGNSIVKATLPKTEIKGDAFVTKIENSVLSEAGSASDVLIKLPGVTYKDEAYEVFGKGTPQIYIN